MQRYFRSAYITVLVLIGPPPHRILLSGMCRNEAKACSILLVDKRFTAPKVSACRFHTDRALRSETDAQFARK